MDEEESWRLDFEFLLISFKKPFFPKFELLNSECGLSAGFYGHLIFFRRIPKSFSFSSGSPKVFLFLQDSMTYTIRSFLFLCRIERVKSFCSLLFLCSGLYQIALLDKRFCFSAELSDLYQSADWTKAFLFLRDPVIYTIQLWEIKVFLFLQDPVTSTILLYQTQHFFSWQVPFVHSFLFSFLHVVLSDHETYVLP